MSYSLSRVSDGAGDSGNMSQALRLDHNRDIENGGDRPKVGYAMRVGSSYARTYEANDYWTTTYVQEIIEERDDYVKFRTNNSIYEWKKF